MVHEPACIRVHVWNLFLDSWMRPREMSVVSTVKQGCHGYPSVLRVPWTLPTNRPQPRVFYPLVSPRIPALENRSSSETFPPSSGSPRSTFLWFEKFRWMENTHELVPNQWRLVLFISLDVWLQGSTGFRWTTILLRD